MTITYNDTLKELPLDQLHHLFVAVVWSDDEPMPENIAKGFMQPWLNSTLVVSAWDGEQLVGAVRILSDTIFRSVGRSLSRKYVTLKCKIFVNSHFDVRNWSL